MFPDIIKQNSEVYSNKLESPIGIVYKQRLLLRDDATQIIPGEEQIKQQGNEITLNENDI